MILCRHGCFFFGHSGLIPSEREQHAVYTRTIVLWALNVSIDTNKLWQNVVVLGLDNREIWHAQPIVQPVENVVVKHHKQGPCSNTVRST